MIIQKYWNEAKSLGLHTLPSPWAIIACGLPFGRVNIWQFSLSKGGSWGGPRLWVLSSQHYQQRGKWAPQSWKKIWLTHTTVFTRSREAKMSRVLILSSLCHVLDGKDKVQIFCNVHIFIYFENYFAKWRKERTRRGQARRRRGEVKKQEREIVLIYLKW